MKTFKVEAIVEIPAGSRYKYELNKLTNRLRIDRLLLSPVPYCYGYINHTLHLDADPTDICIMTKGYPIHPLTEVSVSVIGAFKCTDNGVSDDKLVGIVFGETVGDWIDLAKQDTEYYLSITRMVFLLMDL